MTSRGCPAAARIPFLLPFFPLLLAVSGPAATDSILYCDKDEGSSKKPNKLRGRELERAQDLSSLLPFFLMLSILVPSGTYLANRALFISASPCAE
jgi:hypothetical protein